MIAEREERNDDEFVAWVQRALKRGLARFEEWLSLQTERDDESGKVARYVLADLERGCWLRRKKVGSRMFYGAKKELEEDLWHLRSAHNLSSGSLQMFERVFERFRQENNEYEREKLRMQVQEAVQDAMGVFNISRANSPSLKVEAPEIGQLRDMIHKYQSTSGVTLYEIACYVASEHLDLPPKEYGRMLTPLVGEEMYQAEDWLRCGFVPF